jgi:hypothetical protein
MFSTQTVAPLTKSRSYGPIRLVGSLKAHHFGFSVFSISQPQTCLPLAKLSDRLILIGRPRSVVR